MLELTAQQARQVLLEPLPVQVQPTAETTKSTDLKHATMEVQLMAMDVVLLAL